MIVHYIKDKPPSSLTVVDYVISDIGVYFICYNLIVGSGSVMAHFVLIPENMVLLMAVMVRFVCFLAAFSWLAKSVLRYCYIFNWSQMIAIDDQLILNLVRFASAILSVCFMTSELNLVLDGRPLLHYPVRKCPHV